MKTEYITPKELKKIMRLSIKIDIELGFYLAWHQRTLAVDNSNNWDSNKTMIYKIYDTDINAIFILLNAYAKVHLHKRKLSF